MPIFKYKCSQCGEIFEWLQKSRDEVVECEFCRSKKLEKLPSEFGAINSGSNSCANRDFCGHAGGNCGCCHHKH